MKLLFNHVSRFAFHVTEQSDIGHPLADDERAGETGEAVLVKVCSEAADDEGAVDRAVEEIRDATGQVGVGTVVLFPWAHLAQDLAGPADARRRLEAIGTALEADDFAVLAVPFGWYKAWELESKGHPLSVLSRSV